MIRAYGIGRLTDVPEIRYGGVNDDLAIARFTLATDRYAGGTNNTDFVRYVAFGHNAEFAEKYLTKGTKIFIDGHIQTGSYEKDGVKHYTTDIVVDSFEFCEKKGEESHAKAVEAQAQDDQMELPFK